jgi:chromate transporter
MNLVVLYLLLLKAMLTSFSGLASLPMVRDDFVVERHLLTDRQLNTAVFAGRAGPGPNGLYLISVGYFVDGLPGAAVALMAVMTPAFLILPLMYWMGARAEHPRIRGAIQGVVLASAGLLLSSSVPLTRDAITGGLSLTIVIVTFLALSFSRVDSAWMMLGSAAVGLGAKLLARI